jgi:hypothetical protein
MDFKEMLAALRLEQEDLGQAILYLELLGQTDRPEGGTAEAAERRWHGISPSEGPRKGRVASRGESRVAAQRTEAQRALRRRPAMSGDYAREPVAPCSPVRTQPTTIPINAPSRAITTLSGRTGPSTRSSGAIHSISIAPSSVRVRAASADAPPRPPRAIRRPAPGSNEPPSAA